MRKLGLFSLLLVPACLSPSGSAPGERNLDGVGASYSAIVGGTTDTGDPGVVLVFAQKPGSQSASLCTGEVISPHVVMTAAHCVDPTSVGSGNQFSIFLGTNLNDGSQANNNALWVDAASTDFDSAFDVNNLEGGHDIAVVVTKTALTVTPLAVNQTALTSADANAMLRVVGYGITSTATQQDTSGVKRQVSTPLSQFNSSFLQFGNSIRNTCEGDSGGPAFMTRNGVEVIVGVTSFGDQACAMGGVDTRVDTYWTSFLAPHIMSADGTLPTPSTASGADGGSTSSSSNPGADMGGVTPGQVAGAGSNLGLGSACDNGSQCASGICTLGSHGFCTQTCDPANAKSCAEGMHCGAIGSTSYCLLAEHGCSAGTLSLASSGSGALSLWPLVLLALASLVVARRRRAA